MNLKIGDVITAYHRGYHVIIGFAKNSVGGDLVLYVSVLNSNGKATSRRRNRCHIDYCKKVDSQYIQDQFNQETLQAQNKVLSLSSLLKGAQRIAQECQLSDQQS